MTRLPGDPGPLRWLRYALGMRLPQANRGWVLHDLTDAGWRVRAAVRQLVILLPVAAVFLSLPGDWPLKVFLVVLVVAGGEFVSLAYGDSLRAGRLRQHGLPVPEDRDLGRPTDEN